LAASTIAPECPQAGLRETPICFSTARKLFRAEAPADVTSVRAKSSRRGKSTADKWHQ